MYEILEKFQSDFLDSLINDWLGTLQELCSNLMQGAFFIESQVPQILDVISVASAYEVMYIFCAALLVIKLLWKGWNVYVLWNNGDPDVAPGELLKGSAWAIIVTAAFPLAYEIGVTIALEIVETVFRFLNVSGVGLNGTDGGFWTQLVAALENLSHAGSFTTLLAWIYVIVLILLFIRMLKQGTELFIYRLGVPIAAIGLVNSDGGAWTNYIQMLLKQLFTVMVQYFGIVIGAACIASGTTKGLAVGIAFEVTAFGAPRLLSQVLIPQGSGGMTHKAYAITTVARAFIK